MKSILCFVQNQLGRLFILAFLTFALTSCDSILDNGDLEPCDMSYRIKFKYDYNMKYANAFANEVKSVTLYAFDADGKFVYQRTDEGAKLAAEDYGMRVDIEPGDYHLIAWAGLDNKSFAVPILTPGVSTIDELTVKANRILTGTKAGGNTTSIIKDKLSPLWHGECLQTLTRGSSQREIVVPLVKNTNSVRVVLQQMQGERVDANAFDISITDDNGWMNYDNSLLKDDQLTYQPYYKAQGTTEVPQKNGKTRAETQISVAVAQMTTARLIAEKNPILHITNKETGREVLSIPLVKYLLLTEQEGHKMSEQEYLDRQDEYSMTFFLDENLNWLNVAIVVNGWTIRLNEIGEL